MDFINLRGNKNVLINTQAILCVEETKKGCKIHLVGKNNYVETKASFYEILSAIAEGQCGERIAKRYEGAKDDR